MRASRRASFARPDRVRLVQVERPTGRTTWTSRTRSGCLRCATGRGRSAGHPRAAGGSGRVAPAAGGHPWVVGPDALPAGGALGTAILHRRSPAFDSDVDAAFKIQGCQITSLARLASASGDYVPQLVRLGKQVTMKAILSHPFSGAFYWWLDNQNPYNGSGREKRPEHPYYRTLYGDVDRHLDTALTCAVVYEEIVLPAADAHFPGVRTGLTGEAYRIPELEIATDMEILREAYRLADLQGSELINDEGIARILAKVPSHAKHQAVTDAINDILMSRELSLPVICSPGRRALMTRLIELGVVLTTGAATPGDALAVQLSDYVNVVGLQFRSRTIESLERVKWNDEIRSYASRFQQAISGEDASLESFYESIGVAWLSADAGQEISGTFSSTSRVLNFASLVPVLGTIAGAFGIVADGAAVAAERRTEAHRWFLLGPAIHKIESIEQLEARINELKR